MKDDRQTALSLQEEPDELTGSELEQQWQECAKCVRDGIRSVLEMGRALRRIEAHKLFRARGYTTFKECILKEWKMCESYAYRMMDAADTIGVIENSPRGEFLPTSEKQVRALGQLPMDERPSAWEEACKVANGKEPTAATVDKVVKKILRDKVTPEQKVAIRKQLLLGKTTAQVARELRHSKNTVRPIRLEMEKSGELTPIGIQNQGEVQTEVPQIESQGDRIALETPRQEATPKETDGVLPPQPEINSVVGLLTIRRNPPEVASQLWPEYKPRERKVLLERIAAICNVNELEFLIEEINKNLPSKRQRQLSDVKGNTKC